ncbi:hypothetical protein N9W00_00315 [Arcobacteraceae bacterium]|nr:hypothetical protein [Arcobacteraceae bacterium]
MKVNTLSLKKQEQQFEQDLDYEEFLRANNPEPSEAELHVMEKVFCKSTILKDYKKPLNNLTYQPLQGA